ncbi:MAG: translocation/assembly module TamB domain-containing protein [Flavobacteriaceae bacterium]
MSLDKDKGNSSIKKYISTSIKIMLVILVILIVTTGIALIPSIQTCITSSIIKKVNKQYGIEVVLGRTQIIPIQLKTQLGQLLILDHKKDTLFYIEEVSTSIAELSALLEGRINMSNYKLDGAEANVVIYPQDSSSNLDIWLAKIKRPTKTNDFRFEAQTVLAENLKLRYKDSVTSRKIFLERLELNNLSIENKNLYAEYVSLDNGLFDDFNLMSSTFKMVLEEDDLLISNLYLRSALSEISLNELQFQDVSNVEERTKINFDIAPSFVTFEEFESLIPNSTLLRLQNSLFFEGKGLYDDGQINASKTKIQYLDSYFEGALYVEQINNKKSDFFFVSKDTNFNPLELSEFIELNAQWSSYLNSFSSLRWEGLIQREENNFVVESIVDTNQGTLFSDLKYNEESETFNGLLSSDEFNFGILFKELPQIPTSLDLEFTGQSFELDKLKAQLEGGICTVSVRDKTFEDIEFSGYFSDKLFNGLVYSSQEDFSFDISGSVDFSLPVYNYNINFLLKRFRLFKFGIGNDELSNLNFNLNLNLDGNYFSELEGVLQFNDGRYADRDNYLEFKDLVVNISRTDDDFRLFEFVSDDLVSGVVTSDIEWTYIDEYFNRVKNRILGVVEPISAADQNNALIFDLDLKSKIAALLNPNFKLSENSSLKGNFNLRDSLTQLSINTPLLTFQNYEIHNLIGDLNNNSEHVGLTFAIDSVKSSLINLRELTFDAFEQQDSILSTLKFKSSRSNSNVFELNLSQPINSSQETIDIYIKPSQLGLKGKTWKLNTANALDHKLSYNPKEQRLKINQIELANDDGDRIQINAPYIAATEKQIDLNFKGVQLFKVTPDIRNLELDGVLDGFMTINQINGQYIPSTSLEIEDLSVNQEVVGDAQMVIAGNRDLSSFEVASWIEGEQKTLLNIQGNIEQDEDERYIYKLNAELDDFGIAPFSPLGKQTLHKLRGGLTGEIDVSGSLEKPMLNGLLRLNNGGMAFQYLNTDYRISDQAIIQIENQNFDFINFDFRDRIYDTSANISGRISHENFKIWNLDLEVDTNFDRFLILNTDNQPNSLYYGTGFVLGKGYIKGLSTQLNIEFNGASAQGTSLKIPLGDAESESDYSFINFVGDKTIEQMKNEKVLKTYRGLELNFDIEVTDQAEVEIVIDPRSGSSLKGSGEGLLLMEINTDGKFNMYGEFVAVEGFYNYKFGGLIDKRFKLQPGGTLLWDGDPLAAQLQMDAVYSLNANPSPILESTSFSGRIPTEVLVRLDGELEAPNINFDIAFPNTSSVIQSELQYRLQDPTIRERNAFFLLAQGTFVNDQIGINQQALTGNLFQTASGLLDQVLGESETFDLGLSYEQGFLDPTADVQIENRIGVTVSTQISDRILINGKVGVPVGGVSETVIAGDLEIQIILNDEGTLSAKIFNRENEIRQFLAEQQGYTQGVGLSYQVDFDNFKSLLMKIIQKE